MAIGVVELVLLALLALHYSPYSYLELGRESCLAGNMIIVHRLRSERGKIGLQLLLGPGSRLSHRLRGGAACALDGEEGQIVQPNHAKDDAKIRRQKIRLVGALTRIPSAG